MRYRRRQVRYIFIKEKRHHSKSQQRKDISEKKEDSRGVETRFYDTKHILAKTLSFYVQLPSEL